MLVGAGLMLGSLSAIGFSLCYILISNNWYIAYEEKPWRKNLVKSTGDIKGRLEDGYRITGGN